MLTSSRPVPGYRYCNYSLTCYVHRQYRILFPFVSRYGDKTPKSIPARSYSAFWMIFGMIILSMFTAEVTSGMTAKELVPLNAFLGKKVRLPPNINVDTRNDKVER